MPLTTAALRSVMRQIQEIEVNPVDGIALKPSDNLSEIHFELDGPIGTPFAAGRFHVMLCFDEQYPTVPPKGFFKTKIFHPNISEKGEICVNALKRDWKPDLGLRHILLVIRCLLVEPNPESALNDEAGRLILEDFASYEKKAQMYTNIHALRPANAIRFESTESEGDNSKQSENTTNTSSHGHLQNTSTNISNSIMIGSCIDNNSNIKSTNNLKHINTTSSNTNKKLIDKKKNALRRI